MEKFRVVDENFRAGEQTLPEGFDNIDHHQRAELLKDFNFRSNTSRGLNLTEIFVGWEMYSRVPKESTAEKLGVHTTDVETIRIDVRSWEAMPSLTFLTQKES